jgi:hypothetical protein
LSLHTLGQQQTHNQVLALQQKMFLLFATKTCGGGRGVDSFHSPQWRNIFSVKSLLAFFDDTDNLHRATAFDALQWIHFIHTLNQCRPGHTALLHKIIAWFTSAFVGATGNRLSVSLGT